MEAHLLLASFWKYFFRYIFEGRLKASLYLSPEFIWSFKTSSSENFETFSGKNLCWGPNLTKLWNEDLNFTKTYSTNKYFPGRVQWQLSPGQLLPMKFPPGQSPRDFYPSDNCPWIIPSWEATTWTNAPHEIPPRTITTRTFDPQKNAPE